MPHSSQSIIFCAWVKIFVFKITGKSQFGSGHFLKSKPYQQLFFKQELWVAMTNVLCHKMSPFTKCPLSQNVPFHEMSSVTNCSPKQNILCHYYKINNYRNINTLQFFLLTILSTNSFSLGSLFLFSTFIVSLLLKHLPDPFFLFLETS